jgi:deoxyribonuclease-4
MFGAHLSISGGMHNALLKAETLGCDTVQVFTKNQQQWKCTPLTPECIAEWKSHAKRLKFKKTVSHDSYLINLAATNPEVWRKSVELFVEELTRCALLDIPYLVTHPGAHMGAGEAEGISKIVAAIDVIHDQVPGPADGSPADGSPADGSPADGSPADGSVAHRRCPADGSPADGSPGVITCLEVTAGQGSCLGCKLEHLAEIMERVKSPKRLGVCLDTAHLFAAGYDFRGRKYAAFRKELERTVGVKAVKVIHMNDSKKDLGSRVDRHDHIGRGKIGLEGFRPFVQDEAWAKVPKILETPKEGTDEKGREWDAANLEALRSLM